MALDVLDDDALAGECGGAERRHPDADLDAVERSVIRIGQAGRRAGHKISALAVEQQDAAQHVRLLLLHAPHDGLQYRSQRRAPGQQFQHMVAVLFALLGKPALGEVARQPAPDAQYVKSGGDDAGYQQQRKHYQRLSPDARGIAIKQIGSDRDPQ
jgi:hypothetical protein